MFQASLCPSLGGKDCVLLHVVFCTGCAGCGCVELGHKLCALCEGYCSNSNLHTLHTAYNPAPHNHSQHNQCRKPYAVIHGLVLLMIGIMMPETCWDRGLVINIGLVASGWFISLHRMFHDARSQEPKNLIMEWWQVSLQLFRSAQTDVIIVDGAKLSPYNFKMWDFLIKFRNLWFLICLFITTITFFTISTFHCLTEILYGHGGPIVIWFHLNSRNLWTKLKGLI